MGAVGIKIGLFNKEPIDDPFFNDSHKAPQDVSLVLKVYKVETYTNPRESNLLPGESGPETRKTLDTTTGVIPIKSMFKVVRGQRI